jgi:hypothetical protein
MNDSFEIGSSMRARHAHTGHSMCPRDSTKLIASLLEHLAGHRVSLQAPLGFSKGGERWRLLRGIRYDQFLNRFSVAPLPHEPLLWCIAESVFSILPVKRGVS